MFNYAYVLNGVVVGLQCSDVEIKHEDLILIDENNTVEINSKYDAVKGVFTAPKTENKTIRKISKGAFRRRLTLAEKVAIMESTDSTVKVLDEDLKQSSFVDLDFPQFVGGLDYLVSIDILTQARKTELLVDGSQDEAF